MMAETASSLAEQIRQALLPGHTDHNRLIRLHTGEGGPRLLAESLRGIECIGPAAPTPETPDAGYAFVLSVLCADAALQAPDWLGQPILIELLTAQSRERLRPFHGHITHFERLSTEGGFGYYRLRVEPWLAFLARRRDSFMFQDMSVIEIAEAVFADYAGQGTLTPAWRWALADPSVYRKRSTCTQYDETDLAFLSRLLAVEGLYYWFEHHSEGARLDGARHTLVLADHAGAILPNAQPRIAFHRADATERTDTLQRLVGQTQVLTHAIDTASWDYRALSSRPLTERSRLALEAPWHALPLTDYQQPGPYAWPDRETGERLARRALEALDAQRLRYQGSGSVRTLAPATRFTLEPDRADPGLPTADYQVLAVAHHARNNLNPTLARSLAHAREDHDEAGADTVFDAAPALYANDFELLAATQEYRAPQRDLMGRALHPAPSVTGALSAIVVGEPGQPVHTDRDGRIRLQFHWQRGSRAHSRLPHPSGDCNAPGDARAWSWVRVLTPWAGANWGGHFVPRVGQEVLVEFLEGELDRPVVVGALYNGQGAPDAQNNRINSGAGAATGNAPAWFAGGAAGQRGTGGEAHAHPATLIGLKTQSLAASQQGAGDYNQLAFDLTPREPRAQLATTQHASALQLGALRHQHDNQRLAYRGHGIELVTRQFGALRAGRGMLLSTELQARASGTQMDARLARAQLEAAQHLIVALADSARQQHAGLPAESEAAQLPAVRDMDHSQEVLRATDTRSSAGEAGGQGTAPAWSEPMLVAESPAGIAALTPQDAIVNSGTTLSLGAQDIHLVAQGKSAWAVKNGISLYTCGKASDTARPVQDLGLKLHAAHGPVSLQAQSDRADFDAERKLLVTSTTAHIHLQGKSALQLAATKAAIQIAGGNITLTAPGRVQFKAGQKNLTSGKSAHGEALRSPAVPELDLSPLPPPPTVAAPGNAQSDAAPEELAGEGSSLGEAPGPLAVSAPQQANRPPPEHTLFSQQLDVAGIVGDVLSTETPYKVKDKQGAIVQRGTINELSRTGRFFTPQAEELSAYVGDGVWRFFTDVAHFAPELEATPDAQEKNDEAP